MSTLNTAEGGAITTGGTRELSPLEFVLLHDNDSLNGVGNGDSLNRGKQNTNVFSPKNVRSTAISYSRGYKAGKTGMVSCPSTPESGTSSAWLVAFVLLVFSILPTSYLGVNPVAARVLRAPRANDGQ